MPLTVPSLDELTDRLLADYRARFTSDDLSTLSDNYKRIRSLAMAALGLFHTGKVIYDDLFPDTSAGAALDRLGNIWGVARKGATPARKSDALRVTGTLAAAVAVGDELTYKNGLRYQVNEVGVIPAALYIDVDVVAIDTGAQTKITLGDSSEVLTFSSPPAGINAEAELQLDIDEDGEDAESDGAYRVRIINRIKQPGMGGNANDYRSWGSEITGIKSVYVYPLRRGRGSVDIAALHAGRGTVRLLTSTERTELYDYITTDREDGGRPVAMKSFRVIEVTTTAQNVDLIMKARPGIEYKWDWTDETPPTVSTWTAGTRTLQLSAARPSDMVKGGRVIIKTLAGNGTGEQFEIEDLASTDSVILKKTPATAPVAGDTVYSGGNAVDAVRDAILEHFDELGPAVGDYGTGEWDSDVDPQRLELVALDQVGTRSAATQAPATTVAATDPAFPNDTTLELLIPGEVVVRRDWT